MDDVSERTWRMRLPSKRLRHGIFCRVRHAGAGRAVRQSKPEPQCLYTVIMSWLATSSRPCRASTSGTHLHPSGPRRRGVTGRHWPGAAAPQHPEDRRLFAAGANRRTTRPCSLVRGDLSFSPGRDQKMFVGFLSGTRRLHPRPRQRGLKGSPCPADTTAEPMGSRWVCLGWMFG
jgi:hypothetical protein